MTASEKPQSSCTGAACQSAEDDHNAVPPAPVAGAAVYRIATMDCPVEEGEIRRALERVSGIRSLGFQLGARMLTIHAPAEVLPQALQAIRSAGFDPQPVTPPKASSNEGDDHAGHDHDHNADTGVLRLAMALVLAIGAEALHFFAPETMVMKGLSLVVAAVAI
ncbi:MAG: heavy-metal-associated domain-containing protein, partial [Rhizobiaceae bacterium]